MTVKSFHNQLGTRIRNTTSILHSKLCLLEVGDMNTSLAHTPCRVANVRFALVTADIDFHKVTGDHTPLQIITFIKLPKTLTLLRTGMGPTS